MLGLGVYPAFLKKSFLSPKKAYGANGSAITPHEAMYYEPMGPKSVRCKLCPHQCTLNDNGRGFCRVRECRNGKLYSLVYELPCAVHVDPIEKKPIYHMLPASKSFSIATAGCNSRCKFCQNWQISQFGPEETNNIRLKTKDVVAKAMGAGCRSIAYTYSEPNAFYEYMLDTAKIARLRGIKNIWVTGGQINPEPLRELAKYIDAANIDFKAFDDDYLKNICAQNLKTLTETIKLSKDLGIWVELTNLVVPTLNDDFDKIERMALWIKENVGAGVPLHFSRFWPMYKLKNLPPTPVKTLEKARRIALDAGLEYVYIGNVASHDANNTYCPSCKKLIIQRKGYLVSEINISDSKCRFCGHLIPGIWK
ncbi:MAG: AmmeMemoRadiSam system radical SAM enzyme [Candidatus Omnitrophica bacterium]|nr:AmmeMemoRadiSam system radical SAM enzyme [Candidatus Omnitrophota bacterium]